MIVKSSVWWSGLLMLLPLVALPCSVNGNDLFDTDMGRELLKRSKAADIKSWMDPVHNPCDNFYHFTCANWKRINSAQLFGDYATDQFSDILKLFKSKIMKFLMDPSRGDVVEDKLKDFYGACLRTRGNDSEYLDALRLVYREYGEFSFFKESPVESGNGEVGMESETESPVVHEDVKNEEWEKEREEINSPVMETVLETPVIQENIKNEEINNLVMDTETETPEESEKQLEEVPKPVMQTEPETPAIQEDIKNDEWEKEREETPLMESSNLIANEEVQKFNWWSTVAQIRYTYGLPVIFAVDILEDINNTNQTMVYLGPPKFERTLSAVNPVDQMLEAQIYTFLQQNLGLHKDTVKQVAKQILSFEIFLSNSYTDKREGKSISDLLTPYIVSDLQEEFKDYFDAKKFLQITLGTDDVPEQIYVYDKKYLENTLKIINHTDPNTVEDYILWSLVKYFLIHGKDKAPNKWCVSKVQQYFSKSIEHVIYQQYRSEAYEKEIYDLWHEIKSIFHDSLKGDKYYWMSQSTREHALQKLEKMNLSINSHDDDNFPEFFKDLQISPTNYVANIQSILKHVETLRPNKLDKITHDIEKDELMSYTPIYEGFTNDIKVPVSLLQPYRVWHPVYPKAIQYGTIGFLIAHELVHGFDDEGRLYDADGNASDWWDEKSAYEFESRRRCFQAQYHNYTYGGRLLPDSKLQTENIADNAGIRIAYAAYIRWLEKQKLTNHNIEREDVLTNLEYNNRELFFISYAQLWCADVQSLFKSYLAYSDIHAPSMYRVIGPLANFHDFSWIFRCDMKPDTPMNPSIKCELY